MPCFNKHIKDGDAGFVDPFNRFIQLLVNDPGDQHDEVEAMLYIIILNLQIIEISIIFNVIVVGFNRPAAFIVGIDDRSRVFGGGLKEINAPPVTVLIVVFLGVVVFPGCSCFLPYP